MSDKLLDDMTPKELERVLEAFLIREEGEIEMLEAKLADYEDKIKTVLDSEQALVYLYRHGDSFYVTVSAVLDNEVLGPEPWIVMFDLDGVMETAFVVDRPARYLDKEAFELLGAMDEVLRW